MEYKKKDILEKSIEAIKKYKCFFIEDVIAYVPCGRSKFYELFPAGSDEMDSIKELIEENRIRTKTAIRAKLFKSDKSAELIALYKLIATDVERKALSMVYQDISNTDGSFSKINVTVKDPETLKALKDLMNDEK
jgi:hypothetical protein